MKSAINGLSDDLLHALDKYTLFCIRNVVESKELQGVLGAICVSLMKC